jgi:redox-sensing transcriptional repressor
MMKRVPDQLPTEPEGILEAKEFEGHRIPKAVIKRLSLYARNLQKMSISGVDKVSSKELGEALGLNSAQVRKDLAYFGQFGVPGFGYYVEDLRSRIKSILGTDRTVRLALVGVGNLGQALLSYTTAFSREGFKVIAAFDADKRKVGGERIGVPVFHVGELGQRIRELAVDIVILSVPSGVAQQVVDTAVSAGVTAILNFVPERLIAPKGVKIHYVDLSIEIESLSYYLK